IQDDELGPIRDQGGYFDHSETEIALFAEMNRHSAAAHIVDHGLVDGKTRVGINDFISSINKRQHREENNRLATRNDYHFIACNRYLARAAHIIGDGLAQFGETGGWTVVSPALMQGGDRSFNDVVRGVEIGLADLKVNNFFSLAF